MLFATWLSAASGLSAASLPATLAAVRSLPIALGLPGPSLGAPRLRRLVNGIRHQAPHSSRAIRLPITNYIMVLIGRALQSPSFDNVMFWAACCTAFFGFLRVSEFTSSGVFDPRRHLARDDVVVDPNGVIRIHIKCSKSDQFASGCTILLAPSASWICPVAALSRYLLLRGTSTGPLFLFQDGRPLTPALVNTWLRAIISSSGVSGNYSSHSFRIGAATSAAVAGVPAHLIKVLGRWSSDAYQRYIHTLPEQIVAVARHLV